MTANLRLLFAIPIFFIGFCGFSQEDYWQESNLKSTSVLSTAEKLSIKNPRVFKLQDSNFKQRLAKNKATSKVAEVIYFPDELGKIKGFKVEEATVFSPELAAKYPQIKSYKGTSVTNPNQQIRFSVSPDGVQSMMVDKNSEQSTFMQKTADGSAYVVYARNGLDLVDKQFICETEDAISSSILAPQPSLVHTQVLKKYRVAISATGEYTQYHGGTVVNALAAINATLTRINMVFETDLAVTLELVSNTDLVIYSDATSDPYSGNLNAQAQGVFSSVIGAANYDIGHLFNRANNAGDAGFIGSICRDAEKGSAFSSALVPEGDLFDIDFVAHEMGHQLGANHTWSFESEGTLVQAEPGSGTTIMGYAGIAGADNVAPNGQDYFHYYSIQQITANLALTNCAVEVNLTNTPPVIEPLTNYTIPKGTAFQLSGNASDSDPGDVLTYSWEQIDDGVVTNTTFGPDNPSGANFRSQKPSTNPSRYFPKLSRVIQGNLTQSNPTINSAWETVSNVEREMNFALTVRDNNGSGGQVAAATLKVDVVNNLGTFSVLSQNTAVTYEAGSVQTISWDVANTNQTPINTAEVDIYLSTDGGQTFPIIVAENIKNDGAHDILIPNEVTSQARLMVKASDNIFFAVNSANFSISASPMVLNFSKLAFDVCQPNDLVIPFSYETDGIFSETVSLSLTGLPSGLSAFFSSSTVTANNTNVTLTLSNTNSIAVGLYPLQVVATAASSTKQVPLQLGVYNTVFAPVVLTTPSDMASNTSVDQLFVWEEVPTSTAYDIEIATDMAFTTMFISETVIFNTYKANGLLPETTYYWRVKPKNNCGEGLFNAPFSFTTPSIACMDKFAGNLPITISASGTPTISSTISFTEDLPVAAINVDLNLSHSYLADLKITLTSPQGTKVVLVSNSCGDNRNINATFDGNAASFVCGTTPTISGIVSFKGESSQGDWVLEIEDNAGGDGGALNSFGIRLCVEGQFRPDEDNDGVYDDGDDLCLGTAMGQEVNTEGCPVYRFEPTNFAVSVQSESCRDNNDGVIQIEAIMGLNYSVFVTGNGVNVSDSFTTNYELNDLLAGEYTLCIIGTNGVISYEEYCFDLVITQPDELSVSANLTADGKEVDLILAGASQYVLTLNGVTQQITQENLSLKLENGINTLKVATDLACQGVYEKTFIVGDQPFLYPNPAKSITNLFIGTEMYNAQLQIFAMNGSLVKEIIFSEKQQTSLPIAIDNLPIGIYLVKLSGSTLQGTFKLIKE